MSVPRCKKKKRTHDDKLLKKAEVMLKKEEDKFYSSTASDMSKTAGILYHYALERAFGFTIEDDNKLQNEIMAISDEIIAGKMTIDDIKGHQKIKGFIFD